LSRAEPLENLKVLDLSSTQLHARGVRALATSPTLGHLTRLILNYSRVGDEGIIALAARDQPSLRRLDLRSCGITVQGVRALAQAPWLGQLEGLDLSNNPLSEQGRRMLYEAETLPLHLRAKYKPIEP
jgi:Ran GTPase-activating protein (RanGAP) involved in mRNA processing and transport